MLSPSNLPERFRRRIAVDGANGCWRWQHPLTRDGYGQVSFQGSMRAAHRVVKLLLCGEFEGELDHLCRVRCCVNPEHMEIVSHRENTLRGQTIVAAYAARTHCKEGHPLSGGNLTLRNGARACRECERRKGRMYAARRRSTPEGKASLAAASKRYLEKRRTTKG